MKLDFFPERLKKGISLCDLSQFYEIRFRIGYPVILKSFFRNFYLCDMGKTILKDAAFICTEGDIEEIIENVTERSVYAFNEEIRQGFITSSSGLRIGICGNCVYDGDRLVTIKNFTSLNVRIPHEVKGCSSELCKELFFDMPLSSLIISPPAKGKTTILKDVARKINGRYSYSILIIDERGEFSSVEGENVDKICYSDKLFAFNYALRSMSPEIVITDELCGKRDWECAANAANCGIKIFASMHGTDVNGIVRNVDFRYGVFERYVVLSGFDDKGVKFKVYDGDFKKICG